MTNTPSHKELTEIKAMAELILQKCSRLMSGSGKAPASRKGLSAEDRAKGRAKRYRVIMKQLNS